jgi:proteasome accessory factor C
VIILLGLVILHESLTATRPDLVTAIDNLIAKIKQIVGDVASAAPIVDSVQRAVIAEAIRSRRDLEISYHSTIRDAITTRRVTPLDIEVDFGFEVLNAYCHSATGFRTFRLDNMKSVELIAATSPIPKERNEIEFNWSLQITSRLRTSLERFRQAPGDLPADKEIIVDVKSFSQDWLLRSALSTLGSVEVKTPQQARTSIAKACREALELYK